MYYSVRADFRVVDRQTYALMELLTDTSIYNTTQHHPVQLTGSAPRVQGSLVIGCLQFYGMVPRSESP